MTVSTKTEKSALSEEKFNRLLETISQDPRSQQMKQYVQHGKITTYDHCLDVAKTSYRLGHLFHVKVNDAELARGAFLHDYYLYDWHHHDKRWHGFTHPASAIDNADRDFNLSDREKNIIESHMWPLIPHKLPRSMEAVLVCVADKICSLRETLFCRK